MRSPRARRLLLGAVSIVTIMVLAAGAASHQPAGAGLGPGRAQVPGDALRATSAPVLSVFHVAKRSSADAAGGWLAGVVMIGLVLLALVVEAAAAADLVS